ncbi:MAG: tetratricopeptide repeat protein [Bacteroidaceae bacterium]|jgi:tetratricopeptide (TPR) repeat protein|nr:tetratricopeptide repeat protein [Bacteroidaceae bacterium]MBR1801583.1 tetratricopeptide repeat protein [Bacteroidaceae bacterium]
MAKQQKQVAPQDIEAVTKTEAFFEKYQKQILYGICAIVVIAAAWIGYVQFLQKPKIQKSNEALAKCENYFNADNYDKALNGDGQGCIGFLQVAKEYGSTKAGNLAHLYAGICYAQTEKWEEAKAELEKFSTKDDAIISPASLGLLGNVYANLGQNDKAIEYFLKAAKKADNNSLSPNYLIQAGQLYEAQGKPQKALDCYREVKTKYLNSMAYQEIDKYIERLSE